MLVFALITAVGGSLLATSPAAAAPGSVSESSAVAAASPLLKSTVTNNCVATDYNGNVSMVSCPTADAGGQYWQRVWTGTATFRLQSVLGTCLANLNWTQVYTGPCGSAGTTWQRINGQLYNVHTARWLATDFSNQIYLTTNGTGQIWDVSNLPNL
ncbi:hypothetical protein [Catellatospora methionotrophica]|uniref:hypothetical protein n=1 Tax=Catellatospora methionotrophica TaxID=121620 RepID=UPI00140CAF26|nr:hypothetical protein [Catellatospora methionotrophica]